MRSSNRLETEEWYRKECDKMFYKKDQHLEIIEDEVYLVFENNTTLFLTPLKPSRIWYETWYKLKYS